MAETGFSADPALESAAADLEGHGRTAFFVGWGGVTRGVLTGDNARTTNAIGDEGSA